MEFGVGRGTVPREAWALGTVVAAATTRCRPSTTASTARSSRSRWRSSSWPGTKEQFSYRGKHFVLPARRRPRPGHDRQRPHPRSRSRCARSTSTSRSRRPRPSSTCRWPGHKAVYWLQNADSQKQKWDRYAEIREACGTPVGPGEDRCLVLNIHVAGPMRRHWCKGRPGQDEFNKFLAPYGRFSSYRNPDGSKVAFNHCPTVEESNAAEDPDRRLDRRRRRCHRVLARPARSEAHLHLLRLPGTQPRGDDRAAAPRGRGGVPPPGRADRAPPDHGLTARVSTLPPAAQALEDDGYLVLPAFAEPHAHLDKAFLAERVENPTGDLLGAILAMQRARHVDHARRHHRARRARRAAPGIERLHRDPHPRRSHRARRPHLRGGLDRGSRPSPRIVDIQVTALCAWPSVGAEGADQRALLRDAIAMGIDVVGGCPHLETDPACRQRQLLGDRRRGRTARRPAHRRDTRIPRCTAWKISPSGWSPPGSPTESRRVIACRSRCNRCTASARSPRRSPLQGST